MEIFFIDDLLSEILSWIPNEKKNWLHTKLVNKQFLKISKKVYDPSDKNNYAIRWASYYGYFQVVKELLQDKRVDPSVNDNFAIRFACDKGHLEVVRELLKDKRVDSSARNNLAICWACKNGHLEIVRELLKDEKVTAFIINNYQDILYNARQSRNFEIVKLFLEWQEKYL